MKENKSKEILLQILHDMDDFAKMKDIDYPPIYLLGGSACIIADYLGRATTDIDLIDMNYDASMGRLLRILDDYDFLDMYLTTIPCDFTERAIRIHGFSNIFVLSRVDIILSKIGRYSQIDKADINEMLPSISTSLLARLADNIIRRKDISIRIKEEFIKNYEIFKRDFNV